VILAVVKGDKAIVELLAAKGANILLKNNEGKTALSLARENNYQQIVTFLEKRTK
jgi:ankyrin repeat protein